MALTRGYLIQEPEDSEIFSYPVYGSTPSFSFGDVLQFTSGLLTQAIAVSTDYTTTINAGYALQPWKNDQGVLYATCPIVAWRPDLILSLPFYSATADLPGFTDYSMSNRTYRYFSGKPEFAFGHGLSYTTFKYDNLKFPADTIRTDGVVNLSVEIQNTGRRAGDEVAQLYVHQEKASVKRPAKELRGFQRISLQPGEKKTIHCSLPAAKLAF